MIVLLPAYGRTYETIDAAEADWVDGKDFKIFKGPYCSIRDLDTFKSMSHDVVLVAGTDLRLRKIINTGHLN